MAKKRANGEGNIHKRKDGHWEGRYTAGYDEKTGKRLIKNVLGKTQAEVKEKLAKAVAEVESVDVRRADENTLGAWLQTWYELYAKPHLAIINSSGFVAAKSKCHPNFCVTHWVKNTRCVRPFPSRKGCSIFRVL